MYPNPNPCRCIVNIDLSPEESRLAAETQAICRLCHGEGVLVAPLGLHIPVSVTCVELSPLVDRLLALLLPKLNLLPRFDSVLHSRLFLRFRSRSQKMLKPAISKAATTKPTDIPMIADFGIWLRDCRDVESRSL